MRFRTVALCALVGVVWFAGCNSQDVNNLGADTKKLGQDLAPIAGNAALHTKVSLHLSLHKAIDMSGMHIESRDQTVTVSGTVRDSATHKRVIETVRETTGVEKVIDQLHVADKR